MEKKKINIQNPFLGKDESLVWKELLSKSKPISQEDFLKEIKKVKKTTDQ